MNEHVSSCSPYASPYEVNLTKMHRKSTAPLPEHSTAFRAGMGDTHSKHLPLTHPSSQNPANTHYSPGLLACPATPSLVLVCSVSRECFMPPRPFSSVAQPPCCPPPTRAIGIACATPTRQQKPLPTCVLEMPPSMNTPAFTFIPDHVVFMPGPVSTLHYLERSDHDRLHHFPMSLHKLFFPATRDAVHLMEISPEPLDTVLS